MRYVIEAVEPGSIAEELGVKPGDQLLKIDGQEVKDQIDYLFFMSKNQLTVTFSLQDGSVLDAEIEKDPEEDLGCDFVGGMLGKMRQCRNKCVFCFVDQLPKNMRDTLYVKDDDWRMSFLMGNYITLTNVDETEFSRILARKTSPLFISVHATDGECRKKLLSNKNAGNLMERLGRLAENRLSFHSQIVLVKDRNDGKILEKSIRDLSGLYPYARTVALVPAGLTGHRQGLCPIEGIDRARAREIIAHVNEWQREYLKKIGTRFVFASDELYIRAELPLPSYDEYEDFEQKENGVGLVVDFQQQAREALEQRDGAKAFDKISMATGVDFAPFLKEITRELEKKYNMEIIVYPIPNDFFGRSITVSGLITATDIIKNLKGKDLGDALFIPTNMLREKQDVFLDDISLKELERQLETPCMKIEPDGYDLIEQLTKENI